MTVKIKLLIKLLIIIKYINTVYNLFYIRTMLWQSLWSG